MYIFNPQWTPSPQDGYEKVPMLCDRRTAEVNGLLWLAGQCWSQMSSMLNRGRSLMIFFKLLSLLEVLYLSFFETAWLQVSRLPIDEERERSCIHNFYDVVFLWCLSVSKIWSRTPRRLSPIKILTRRHSFQCKAEQRERFVCVHRSTLIIHALSWQCIDRDSIVSPTVEKGWSRCVSDYHRHSSKYEPRKSPL